MGKGAQGGRSECPKEAKLTMKAEDRLEDVPRSQLLSIKHLSSQNLLVTETGAGSEILDD